MNEERKPKAGERLEALEIGFLQQSELLSNTSKRTGEMEMIIFNLSRESEILKDALQLIHEKLDAVISLSGDSQPLDSESINNKITEQKVETLKKGIEIGLEKNNIEKTEVVGDKSLIVSRELEKTGEVVNPRLQFMVGRLTPELSARFTGKVVGDLIEGEGDRLNIEIIEIYDFVEQELSSEEPSE